MKYGSVMKAARWHLQILKSAMWNGMEVDAGNTLIETLCQKQTKKTVECEIEKHKKSDKNILRTTTINREYLIFNIQTNETKQI